MRLGSETAYRKALESWDTLLRELGAGEVAYAQELFALADALSNAPSLTAALEDASRCGNDRAQLVANLFGDKVCGEVSDLVQGLARETWSEDGDLIRTIEALGVQTVLAAVQREGLLDQVESELYIIRTVLSTERKVRNVLRDVTYSLESRQALAATVFNGVTPYTLELLNRALAHAPETVLRVSLDGYSEAVGERSSHLVAEVTAAIPLSVEQEQRLVEILSKQYGKDVRVLTTVDPSVVGGVKVTIGANVIDATIASRLATVKEVFSKRR